MLIPDFGSIGIDATQRRFGIFCCCFRELTLDLSLRSIIVLAIENVAGPFLVHLLPTDFVFEGQSLAEPAKKLMRWRCNSFACLGYLSVGLGYLSGCPDGCSSCVCSLLLYFLCITCLFPGLGNLLIFLRDFCFKLFRRFAGRLGFCSSV